MEPQLCLTIEELRDFALGRVASDRGDEIAQHLDTCVLCEDTVTSLENTADSLLQHLRIPLPESSAISPVAMAAMEREKNAAGTEPVQHEPDETAPPVHVRDYQLLHQLGAGGMGTVYQAIHTKLDRVVAIKLLPANRMQDADAVARFEREMKASGRLNHPSIVTATDAGSLNDTHFLVMEFVDGLDLTRLQKAADPLSIPDACDLVRQAAIGVQCAHDEGMVHRDIKPSNIMLDGDGRVKVLDLGLALLAEQVGTMDELTSVGQLMGTLDYMAPEQCDDSHEVDARADVYSLGATLFKLLTGEVPFGGDKYKSAIAKIRALATLEASAVSSIRNDVPPGLDALVASMLAKNPDDRPASAVVVADQLTQFCHDSNLKQLIQRGRAAAESNTRPVDPSTFMPSLSAGPDVQNQTQPRLKRISVFRRFGLMAMAAALMIAAGITIWIQTDTGKLVIEADEAALVRVVRGNDVVKSWQVVPGKNETTIRAGKYEIHLDGAFDSLELDEDSVAIIRGGDVLVKVTKEAASSPPAVQAIATPNANQEANTDQEVDALRQQSSALAARLLGAKLEPLSPAEVKRLAPDYAGGMRVLQVQANGPFAKGRVLENDILVGLHDYEAKSHSDLVSLLTDQTEVVGLDGQITQWVTVRAGQTAITNGRSRQESPRAVRLKAYNSLGSQLWRRLGLRVGDPVSGSPGSHLGGLLISKVRRNSPADKNGIQRGDALIGLHIWATRSDADLKYILANEVLQEPVQFQILRDGELRSGRLQARVADISLNPPALNSTPPVPHGQLSSVWDRVFKGRTWREWQQQMNVETSPDELVVGVEAMLALNPDRTGEAVKTIFQHAGKYGDQGPAIGRHLGRMGEPALATVLHFLGNGTADQRRLALACFDTTNQLAPMKRNALTIAAAGKTEFVVEPLFEAARDLDEEIGHAAIRFARILQVNSLEEWGRVLTQLSSRELRSTAFATDIATERVQFEPGNADLAAELFALVAHQHLVTMNTSPTRVRIMQAIRNLDAELLKKYLTDLQRLAFAETGWNPPGRNRSPAYPPSMLDRGLADQDALAAVTSVRIEAMKCLAKLGKDATATANDLQRKAFSFEDEERGGAVGETYMKMRFEEGYVAAVVARETFAAVTGTTVGDLYEEMRIDLKKKQNQIDEIAGKLGTVDIRIANMSINSRQQNLEDLYADRRAVKKDLTSLLEQEQADTNRSKVSALQRELEQIEKEIESAKSKIAEEGRLTIMLERTTSRLESARTEFERLEATISKLRAAGRLGGNWEPSVKQPVTDDAASGTVVSTETKPTVAGEWMQWGRSVLTGKPKPDPTPNPQPDGSGKED